MARESLGPKASEPEQRDYLVALYHVDAELPGGEGISMQIIRSHHALDAARELAERHGLPGPWHDYAPEPRVWCTSNADTVIAATVNGPDARAALMRVELVTMRSTPQPQPQSSNDERAAVQRRIADLIRLYIDDHPAMQDAWRAVTADDADASYSDELATLALAATNDAVWDALAQVRQAILLAR